ncbi:MAG: SDR family oxidoreductase [Actinomycetota bacterium]|nr:SDR family oxidoreductase [Actinomycetota bacterium]
MPKARAMARVALVTGANCGIGAATAIELAARGASVLLTYLRASAPADDNASPAYREARAADASRLVEAIRASGGRAEALEADLIDTATPARLFDCAEAQLGPVEVLVCNASGWVQDSFGTAERDRFGRPLRAVSVDTFEAQFAVDARATALLIAEFARRHIARAGDWGRIVSLTSGGPDGFPSEVSYGAAKAALENYTMSAAWELGGYGITANVVYPPATDTGWLTPDIRATASAQSPLGRVGEPGDVARVIAMLCSDDARSVTGNVVRMR